MGRSPFPDWVDRFHRSIQREVREQFGTELRAGMALALGASLALARQRRRSR
jgi:hypothetical protein